jgi:hypothetical protein
MVPGTLKKAPGKSYMQGIAGGLKILGTATFRYEVLDTYVRVQVSWCSC